MRTGASALPARCIALTDKLLPSYSFFTGASFEPLHAIDIREAFLLALITFAGVGDDAAVGGFQVPAPFAFLIF
jgi:hypothetical protein